MPPMHKGFFEEAGHGPAGPSQDGRNPVDPPHAPMTVSEARLSSVLETAVDGIIVIDDSARILMFNKACERLFGYTAAEAIGKNVKLIMPSEYSHDHDQYMHNYMSTGVRKIIGIGREVRGRHRDGTTFPIELSVGEAKTPDGRQFIGILRDVRARKETEERLNQLQTDLLHMARVSAMDEMGAALAHELNQPLTAVMLYLQAVGKTHNKVIEAHRRGETGAQMDDAIGSILDKALREAARAGNIILRMRQFVEKREPERNLIALNPLIDDAVELTLVGYRRGTAVVRNYQEPLPLVRADATQIQQIVVNLVRNALEALKGVHNATVWIETKASGGQVKLQVRDNGPGIPEEAMAGLFKAFSSSKKTGLGLGLAISRTIAQNHGGDLAVDPGGGGEGACFSLILPDPALSEPAANRRD